MKELIRTIAKYLLAAICLVVALFKALFNPPPTYKNMKNLLFAFMLLVSLQSNAQKVKKDSLFISQFSSGLTGTTGYSFKFNDPSVMYCMVKEGSDTLEVFYGTKIRFIKIGKEVFEITSPSLQKVEPLSIGTYYKQFWPNNTQPAIH